MSEQEKNSGRSAISSSVVMVDKTNGSRHKQLFRPNELQEDPEIHHKRPEAPLVPFLVDSDKYKQSPAKKLASSMERRDHSPESITLAPIEVDSKKIAATSLPPIPISTDVSCLESGIKGTVRKSEKNPDEDSINEEIAELQPPEMVIKRSECHTLSSTLKIKETSWNDKKYKENIAPKESTLKNILDRRASITPCFRQTGPHESPSGISINFPKKSLNCVNQCSGININISKKCIASKSKITSDEHRDNETNESSLERAEKIKCDTAFANFVDNLREKFCNIQTKVKSIFQA